MKRHLLDLDDLRERYASGTSEKALSEFYGVSRGVIRRRLLEIGVEPRNRSAANRERMGRLSPDERRDLTAASRAARRSTPVRDSEVEAKARWRETSKRFASPRELMLLDWMRLRGVDAVSQKAAGRYNLDLAVDGQVAVELHWSPANPARRATTRKRSHYLLDRGWSVIYVWVGRDGRLEERAADEVVAFAKRVQRLPAGAREYRVIRGTGERVMVARFDPDQAASIPAPEAHSRLRSDD